MRARTGTRGIPVSHILSRNPLHPVQSPGSVSPPVNHKQVSLSLHHPQQWPSGVNSKKRNSSQYISNLIKMATCPGNGISSMPSEQPTPQNSAERSLHKQKKPYLGDSKTMKNLHTIWVLRNCVQHTLSIFNSIKGIFPLYFPLSGNDLLYHCPWKSSLWQNTTFLAKRQLGWYSHLGLVLYLIKRVVANFSKKLLMSGYNSPEPLLSNHRSRKYTSTSPQRSWAHPNPRFSRKISPVLAHA